jgi:hypothetical protein
VHFLVNSCFRRWLYSSVWGSQEGSSVFHHGIAELNGGALENERIDEMDETSRMQFRRGYLRDEFMHPSRYCFMSIDLWIDARIKMHYER